MTTWHDASQGLRYPVAHHSPLQARHDQADAGAGLDPRPALLPAPGQHTEAHLLHFLLITSNQINLAQSTHFHCYSLNLFSFRASSLKSGVTHCSQSTNSAQPSELLTNGNRLECAHLVKLLIILQTFSWTRYAKILQHTRKKELLVFSLKFKECLDMFLKIFQNYLANICKVYVKIVQHIRGLK